MDIERYKLLNPVSYTYLNDEKVKLGLIAQEVFPVCSEAVSMVQNENLHEEDEISPEGIQLGLDYNTITILNVDIIKKLINRIEELESTVEKLIARPVVAKWMQKKIICKLYAFLIYRDENKASFNIGKVFQKDEFEFVCPKAKELSSAPRALQHRSIKEISFTTPIVIFCQPLSLFILNDFPC
jgi:hypothetical protein